MKSNQTNKDIGRQGEKIAEEYLINAGYQILERNWRYSRSEVDLIAKDGHILVFIEVKTRSYDFFGTPETFVTDQKELLLHEAASVYMDEIGHVWEFRFDIIAVMLQDSGSNAITHFKDAF